MGAIAAVVGALGITGAGIRARLGQATTQLQTYLWGAELDLAVADAVLIGPEGWGAGLGHVPAIGPVPMAASNLETLREFRDALRDDKSRQRRKRIGSPLAPEAEFIDASGVGSRGKGRDEIIRWLLRERDAAAQIAATPESVVAGRPGWLVTCVGERADACWVREGQIRHWQRFSDIDSAREKSWSSTRRSGGRLAQLEQFGPIGWARTESRGAGEAIVDHCKKLIDAVPGVRTPERLEGSAREVPDEADGVRGADPAAAGHDPPVLRGLPRPPPRGPPQHTPARLVATASLGRASHRGAPTYSRAHDTQCGGGTTGVPSGRWIE